MQTRTGVNTLLHDLRFTTLSLRVLPYSAQPACFIATKRLESRFLGESLLCTRGAIADVYDDSPLLVDGYAAVGTNECPGDPLGQSPERRHLSILRRPPGVIQTRIPVVAEAREEQQLPLEASVRQHLAFLLCELSPGKQEASLWSKMPEVWVLFHESKVVGNGNRSASVDTLLAVNKDGAIFT